MRMAQVKISKHAIQRFKERGDRPEDMPAGAYKEVIRNLLRISQLKAVQVNYRQDFYSYVLIADGWCIIVKERILFTVYREKRNY